MGAALAVVLAGAGHGRADGALADWLDGEGDRDRLPRALTEVSGLAVDGDGHLWAHDDERGVVHRLEDGTGRVAERRILGPGPVRGDFEGLAFDGRRFHLVTSTGTLVSFEPGADEDVLAYSVRRTRAETLCEVEGLEFDPGRGRLVMACKTPRPAEWRRHLVLLEVALPGDADDIEDDPLPAVPRVLIGPDLLDEAGVGGGRLSPSGVARSPRGWLVVAARERRLLEVDDEGRVLDQARLPGRHPQAEGVALEGPDVLTLADEGGDGSGHLTRYARPGIPIPPGGDPS